MPLAADSFVIDGFQGEPALYEFELTELGYDSDAGEVIVTVEGWPDDGDPSAFVDDARITLIVDGNEHEIDGTFSFSGQTGSDYTVRAPGDRDSFVEVVITAPNWDDLDGGTPRADMDGQLDAVPPFDPELVMVDSCSVSDQEVVVGEQVDVSVTVENDNEQAASADVTIEFGDVSETVSVTIPSGSSRGVEATFEPETPDTEYQPSVSLTAGVAVR